MSVERQSVRTILLKLAGEASLVAAVVFGLGWAGMHLAQVRHARPIRADANGAIHLQVRDSDWHGNATFVEVGKYDGAWQCEGQWEISWLLAVDNPCRREIAVELAWPVPPPAAEPGAHAQPASPKPSATTRPKAGRRFEVEIGGHRLQGVVPDRGAEGKWETVRLGEVELGAGSYRLVVRPADPPGFAALCLRSVTLAPAAP